MTVPTIAVPSLSFQSATPLNAAELERPMLRARDGDIGRVSDCFFDVQTWEIRYLVVETDESISNRAVLVSPEVLAAPVWTDQVIPVRLTMEEVRESPPWDGAEPLSSEYEGILRDHFGWPDYLSGTGFTAPGILSASRAADGARLYRMKSLRGWGVHATDGRVGRVSGFFIDDAAWMIRFLVVDTVGHGSSRQAAVSPASVESIDWNASDIFLKVEKQRLQGEAGAPRKDRSPTCLPFFPFNHCIPESGRAEPQGAS